MNFGSTTFIFVLPSLRFEEFEAYNTAIVEEIDHNYII